MPAAPSYSIAVIARNEAPRLPRLLGSLADFLGRAGEILLVDTGSSDDTAAVARAHGCRTEETGARFERCLTEQEAATIEARFARAGDGPLASVGERLFHFGDAREHASSRARHCWVMQLDASDEVLAFDLDFLEAAVQRGDACQVEYRQLYGRSSHRVARFYDRRRVHWKGRVHELPCAGPDGPAAHPVRCGDGQLLIRHHKDETKQRNYLSGLALDAIAFPESPRWLHYLGRELYYLRWYRSALPVLQQHAARGDAGRAERSESLCLAGACSEALEDPAAAVSHYRRAVEVDPARREPHLRLSALQGRRGEFVESAASARAALAIERRSGFIELDANYGSLPHALLYWALFWLGRRDEAQRHWDICRRLEPDEPIFAGHSRLFTAPASTRG